MSLRPYQVEFAEAVVEARRQGVWNQLGVMATGLGKTAVATALPDALRLPRGKRLLFLVHMDLLAFQAAEAFRRWTSRTVGIEKAEHRAGDADIVVASVQTLGRGHRFEGADDDPGAWSYSARLRRFNPDDFQIVVLDEAHHSYKSTLWASILRYFQVLKGENPDTRKTLLGITATPNRTDNVGAEVLFDKIVYYYGIREGVRDGWLSQIQAYRVETEANLSRVHTRGGDLDPEELEREVNTPTRNALVVRKYQELTPSSQALFFTVDVQHASDLAAAFQQEGIPVYPISGKTPQAEVDKLVRLMGARGIRGLCSCQKILEGFDCPSVTAAFMTRPTKSRLLYQQMVGRALRLHPSPEEVQEMAARGEVPDFVKRSAVVVDFADNTGRHSLVTAPTLFGLKEKFDGQGRLLLPQVEEIERLEEAHPGADLRGEPSLDAIKSNIERLDLLAAPQTPPEVAAVSGLTWFQEGEGSYRIALPDLTVLSVREDTLGGYHVYRHRRGIRTLIFMARDLADGIRRAESEIPESMLGLIDTGRKWRSDPPSDSQCRYHHQKSAAIRGQFPTWQDYYRFASERFRAGDRNFSKGAMSAKIDAAVSPRV